MNESEILHFSAKVFDCRWRYGRQDKVEMLLRIFVMSRSYRMLSLTDGFFTRRIVEVFTSKDNTINCNSKVLIL